MAAKKAFISFRHSDGNEKKEDLQKKFKELKYVIDKSESGDHSDKTDDQIWEILKPKLKDTSITVVILTPKAVNYKRNFLGKIDDWLYDELRYSLEDRENNRTNGVIALYTEEVENSIFSGSDYCSDCEAHHTMVNNFDNLVRKNMFNVKDEYKYSTCSSYNSLEDNYISLISFDDFIENPQKYIDNAIAKRDRQDEFKPVKRMD